MKQVTILQVVPRLETGGSEQAAIEITEALVRAGASSLVATEGGRMATAISKASGEIVLLPVASKNPLTIYANASRLARLVVERDVDLLHARSRAPAWSALIAARRTKRPFVTTYHGAYSGLGPIKALYNGVMGRGDRVIANSRYTADLVATRQHVARDRIRIIYRGIDLATYAQGAIDGGRLARLRAAWGIAAGQPVVLQPARMTELKGHRYFIEAAGRLARDSDLGDAAFILAGDTQGRKSYVDELHQLIASLDLTDRVRLVGHCDDMPAAYALATVAIVASPRPEAFGRTSIEAQASGCPVIVTDIGATPETMIPARPGGTDHTGWIVPVADSAALAVCVAEALRLSPAERHAMALRARDQAGKFALAHMQRATLAVYDELLGTRLAPSFGSAA